MFRIVYVVWFDVCMFFWSIISYHIFLHAWGIDWLAVSWVFFLGCMLMSHVIYVYQMRWNLC